MQADGELSPVEVDEQAADWFARRAGERFSAADEARFQRWLKASPAHAQAYADLELLWDDMDQIQSPRAEPPPRAAVVPLRKHWPHRLLSVAASVLLLVGLVSFALLYKERPQLEMVAQAEQGQLREIALVDGSRITLNMGSRIEVRYFKNRREVTLLEGEGFFSVAPDATRPFLIEAGLGQVRVVGTRFNVRLGKDMLDVAVEQGTVSVDAGAAGMPQVLLSAGEVVKTDYLHDEQEVSLVAPHEVASWRSGQLIFHDRPLAQLLQELSRYMGKPVELTAANLARHKLSGSLDIHEPQAFLASLPLLLPVRVDIAKDGSVSINAL